MIARLKNFVWLTLGLVLGVCLAGCKAEPTHSVLQAPATTEAPAPEAPAVAEPVVEEEVEKVVVGKIDPVVNGTTKYYLLSDDHKSCWVYAKTWLEVTVGDSFTCKWEDTF